jgi:hypothetical protein
MSSLMSLVFSKMARYLPARDGLGVVKVLKFMGLL